MVLDGSAIWPQSVIGGDIEIEARAVRKEDGGGRHVVCVVAQVECGVGGERQTTDRNRRGEAQGTGLDGGGPADVAMTGEGQGAEAAFGEAASGGVDTLHLRSMTMSWPQVSITPPP